MPVQRRRLTAVLAGQPVHLLVRLSAKSVFYGDPVSWPGRNGRLPRHGIPVISCNDPPGRILNRTSP
jgi:hypothetical protein